jgi:hypothetical protein
MLNAGFDESCNNWLFLAHIFDRFQVGYKYPLLAGSCYWHLSINQGQARIQRSNIGFSTDYEDKIIEVHYCQYDEIHLKAEVIVLKCSSRCRSQLLGYICG